MVINQIGLQIRYTYSRINSIHFTSYIQRKTLYEGLEKMNKKDPCPQVAQTLVKKDMRSPQIKANYAKCPGRVRTTMAFQRGVDHVSLGNHRGLHEGGEIWAGPWKVGRSRTNRDCMTFVPGSICATVKVGKLKGILGSSEESL